VEQATNSVPLQSFTSLKLLNSHNVPIIISLGVEQATNSVPLQSFTFPRAAVLLLGNEQSGIPASLLHLLDVCVEIPTLGECWVSPDLRLCAYSVRPFQ